MQPNHTQPTLPPISTLYGQSQQAFYRRLPELLQKHDRQWVAFHGEELIGFAGTQSELHQRCIRRGLKDDEFVVLFADEAALGDQMEIDLPLNP